MVARHRLQRKVAVDGRRRNTCWGHELHDRGVYARGARDSVLDRLYGCRRSWPEQIRTSANWYLTRALHRRAQAIVYARSCTLHEANPTLP